MGATHADLLMFKLVMQVHSADQQKSAWFKSHFCETTDLSTDITIHRTFFFFTLKIVKTIIYVLWLYF